MKYLLLLLTLFVTSVQAEENYTAKLGGTITTTSDLYNGTFSYVNSDKEKSPLSYYVDSDFFYSNSNNKTSRNEVNAFGKVNYELGDGKNYLQSGIRYEYNQFAPYKEIVTPGIGHGYRLFHTPDLKVSAESSIGYATGSNGLDQTIFRESIWASYKINPKTVISNKFLWETGGVIDYKRNVLEVDYDFSEHIIGSVSNTLVRDWRNTSTTIFSVGVKF